MTFSQLFKTMTKGVPMKKEDIIRTVNALPFEKQEFWLTAGAAMVLHGLRENTHDLDIGCTSRMADQLEALGYRSMDERPDHRRFVYTTDVEFSENFFLGARTLAEGIPVLTLESLLEMKLLLNREKDQKDIALLRAALSPDCGDRQDG